MVEGGARTLGGATTGTEVNVVKVDEVAELPSKDVIVEVVLLEGVAVETIASQGLL